MQRRLASSIVLCVVLAACGAGPGGPGGTSGPGATNRPASTQAGGGDVDCAAIRSAAEKLIGIQLLAQITTPQSIETLKSIGNLDLDEMLTALDDLHALDGIDSPLGSPRESIKHYEAAAAAAKALFAMEPVTQAAIDAYNEAHVGTIGEFLGKQAAISSAIGEADC
jgi:hypothetical protein